MKHSSRQARGWRLSNGAGVAVEVNSNGSLRRFDCGAASLLLFPGSEIEGGPANLYLRRRGAASAPLCTALLGPGSSTQFEAGPAAARLVGRGAWRDMHYSVTLALAASSAAWFWHVQLENHGTDAQQLDLTYAQDVALAPYGAVRMNEYFVSQYIDHTPLHHAARGWLVASRQNQAVEDRHPWCLLGSLRAGAAYATDALQLYGLAGRAGAALPGLIGELPGCRLQHEHSMVVIRDEPIRLAPGERVNAGFFGLFQADHAAASSAADLEQIASVLALPDAHPHAATAPRAPQPLSEAAPSGNGTLFTSAPLLPALELDQAALQQLFPPPWRHAERDDRGRLLSFFYGADRHVVLREKELRVQRPHGQLLRTGRHLTPSEAALTSTVWMGGVFHSMVTQGHVNINRVLSTVHGYLSLFRAQGQRVFVQLGADWYLLDVPSAFEMSPAACRWIYRHQHGVIELRSQAHSDPHALSLSIALADSVAAAHEPGAVAPARFLISHHLAVGGDDGAAAVAVEWRRDGADIVIAPPPGSELARRFPQGRFRIAPLPGTELEGVGGDERLFLDGRSRDQPYLCVATVPAVRLGVSLRAELIGSETQSPLLVSDAAELIPRLTLAAPAQGTLAAQVAQLADIVPWYAQNALVHYLAPRGLEQYSGGGWGTRDVCQGPVEMLLALGRTQPLRDVLLRVMAAQNPDGDWPQWFMFFERERQIRAGDSHGDIVLWPLVVLGQYLIASGDRAVLDEQVPFFDPRGAQAGERSSIWEHAQRALALIGRRVIPGTALAAYGHGDWNDSLQPADPKLRERLCSAWTVTLQVQALQLLARALRSVGRAEDAVGLESAAREVGQDFQRLLLPDGVLTGYALFEDAGQVRYLLHPSDDSTGVRYSALAMIHAILEGLFTPAQAREHLRLLEAELSGPDGVRLFDRPLPYHGGTQRLFQRAETATFFGREIGLMYMHAHLRFAQALAHLGEAERFLKALCQANPIGLRALVPSATLRQANCYYSSSDAAFLDRYQACAEYDRVARGAVALDGGWRVYSSGAGIALGLMMRHFLGVSCEARALRLDPVIAPALDGLSAHTRLLERPVELRYRIGAAGCGVQRVLLNGAPVPFTRESNPYRIGAAVIVRALLQERLADGDNVLTLELG